uniref:Uncharacterized protein n=1 Tax=Aetherobacter sp. TaxID=2022431 RepID=A0A3S7UV64_9BACT|nr:hypothetical protein [Aetherobacter sp.]
MNADKLRQIQAALARDFAAEPVSPCEKHHVHLVYAHIAEVVDAATLVPLSYPDLESRVDAWTWPTTTAYEACEVAKDNQPYRDFIRARFLWKERAGVTLTELPSNADTPAATAADGGTLITIHDGPRLGPTGSAAVSVKVTLPAAPAAVADYPTLRRVCLSTPGQEGKHAELETGVNEATVEYPQRDLDSALHLVGEMPWFRFQLPSGTAITEDPWAYRINYDVTPASQYGQHVFESSTSQDIGGISRYKDNNGVYHYGFSQKGNDTKAAIRSGYDTDLSTSRRLVVAGVLDVEGGPSAVTSYDGPKASWGMNQWTWPRNAAVGEIHQILCYIYDFFPEAFDTCFGRYGIGVSFASRNRTWSPSTYNSPVLFRVPCCKLKLGTAEITRSMRAGLDAIGQHLALDELHGTIASSFSLLTREDTTSVAMLYLLYRAGHNAEVQKAQVQWTSYRITYGKRNLRNPTNDAVLRGFLVSLGSNMSDTDRADHANNGIAAGVAEGHTYPALTAAFSDVGTTEEWRDWAVRCDNASKTTTPAAAPAVTNVPIPQPDPRRQPAVQP